MVQTTGPIEQPVTGREALGDLSQPRDALIQFYKALNARDLEMMQANWDTSSAAVMDNPLGGVMRGWENIRSVYARLFGTDGEYAFEFWDYTMHRSDDVFFVVGRERGQITAKGECLNLAIRTTRLFAHSGGRWRQVHHHGSIDDPRLLARYQNLVTPAGPSA